MACAAKRSSHAFARCPNGICAALRPAAPLPIAWESGHCPPKLRPIGAAERRRMPRSEERSAAAVPSPTADCPIRGYRLQTSGRRLRPQTVGRKHSPGRTWSRVPLLRCWQQCALRTSPPRLTPTGRPSRRPRQSLKPAGRLAIATGGVPMPFIGTQPVESGCRWQEPHRAIEPLRPVPRRCAPRADHTCVPRQQPPMCASDRSRR